MAQTSERQIGGITAEKIIGWIVAAVIAWAAVEARVRVLEVRFDRVAEDVAEMRSDVKTLIRAVRP